MNELSLEELIVSIVEPLVDFPEDIHVSSLEKDEQVIYTLSVNAEDTGKVIGKQGRTAKAIRTVIFAASAESSKKVQPETRNRG